MQMGDKCLNVAGVLVLLAGLSFLAFGLGSLDGGTAHLASGALLGLTGLGILVHGLGMCPGCKAAMPKMSKK